MHDEGCHPRPDIAAKKQTCGGMSHTVVTTGPMQPTPLLVLYASQTGNAQVSWNTSRHQHAQSIGLTHSSADECLPKTLSGSCLQDVAERVAREADALLWEPRVAAMDAYAITGLPHEQAVVMVASTTGQVCAAAAQACMRRCCAPRPLKASAYNTHTRAFVACAQVCVPPCIMIGHYAPTCIHAG